MIFHTPDLTIARLDLTHRLEKLRVTRFDKGIESLIKTQKR